MGKKTRRNRLLVVLAVALIAGVWSFTAIVDTAWATKPSDPGGGNPGGGGHGTTPLYHQVDLGKLKADWPGRSFAWGVNELAQVVGHAMGSAGHSRAFIIVPLDTDGDGQPDTWNRDLDSDGVNDLMIDLGIPNGIAEPVDTQPNDVNCFGQVVGYLFYADSWVSHAILVNPEDTDGDGKPDTWYRDDDADGANDLMTDLGEGDAWAINDLGQVLHNGNFLITPTVVDGVQVWYLDDDGDGVNDLMIDLGTLGGDTSYAADINNLGQVVGGSNYVEQGELHAFLINPADSDGDGQPDTWYRDDNADGRNDLAIELAPFEASSTYASAINDDGQVAGAKNIDIDGNYEAYLLTPEDTDGDGAPDTWFRDQDGDGANDLMVNLGMLKGMESSHAEAVNNSAQVVGVSTLAKGGKYGYMQITYLNYVWENGEMKELDPLTDSDAPAGDPYDINDAGQIVTEKGYLLLPIEPTP